MQIANLIICKHNVVQSLVIEVIQAGGFLFFFM